MCLGIKLEGHEELLIKSLMNEKILCIKERANELWVSHRFIDSTFAFNKLFSFVIFSLIG